MLIPVHTSGTKPPLFFVHGLNGLMSLGSSFAVALGPEQPLYSIHANGIDGRQPVLHDVQAMVQAYTDEIQAARPTGPIRIGGMCTGCFIALEVASSMQQQGRPVGPVILVDPPPLPAGYHKRNSRVDPQHPKIAEQLYQQIRGTLLDHATVANNDVPFDPNDPKQMHAATLAGVGVLVALFRHVSGPFSGPVELIISAERASGFFHPMMPWAKALAGPRIVHVVPWDHEQLFRAGRESICRLLKFILDQAPLEMFTTCVHDYTGDIPDSNRSTEQPVA